MYSYGGRWLYQRILYQKSWGRSVHTHRHAGSAPYHRGRLLAHAILPQCEHPHHVFPHWRRRQGMSIFGSYVSYEYIWIVCVEFLPYKSKYAFVHMRAYPCVWLNMKVSSMCVWLQDKIYIVHLSPMCMDIRTPYRKSVRNIGPSMKESILSLENTWSCTSR